MIPIVSLAKFSIPFSPVTDLSVHPITIEVSVQVWQRPEIWMCFLYHSTWCVSRALSRRLGENRGIAQKLGKRPEAASCRAAGTGCAGGGCGPAACPEPSAPLRAAGAAGAARPARGPAPLQGRRLPQNTRGPSGGSCFFGSRAWKRATAARCHLLCAAPRTGYFCSWAIMESHRRGPNDPCRRELISGLLQ